MVLWCSKDDEKNSAHIEILLRRCRLTRVQTVILGLPIVKHLNAIFSSKSNNHLLLVGPHLEVNSSLCCAGTKNSILFRGDSRQLDEFDASLSRIHSL